MVLECRDGQARAWSCGREPTSQRRSSLAPRMVLQRRSRRARPQPRITTKLKAAGTACVFRRSRLCHLPAVQPGAAADAPGPDSAPMPPLACRQPPSPRPSRLGVAPGYFAALRSSPNPQGWDLLPGTSPRWDYTRGPPGQHAHRSRPSRTGMARQCTRRVSGVPAPLRFAAALPDPLW